MPTLSIKIVATSSLANSKTISQVDLDRFMAAYKKIYGQVSDGNNGLRDMTPTEMFNVFCGGLFLGIKNNVSSQEKSDASVSAQNAVTDITLT